MNSEVAEIQVNEYDEKVLFAKISDGPKDIIVEVFDIYGNMIQRQMFGHKWQIFLVYVEMR